MKLLTKGEVQRKIASLQASKNTVINNFINKLIHSDFYDHWVFGTVYAWLSWKALMDTMACVWVKFSLVVTSDLHIYHIPITTMMHYCRIIWLVGGDLKAETNKIYFLRKSPGPECGRKCHPEILNSYND